MASATLELRMANTAQHARTDVTTAVWPKISDTAFRMSEWFAVFDEAADAVRPPTKALIEAAAGDKLIGMPNKMGTEYMQRTKNMDVSSAL